VVSLPEKQSEQREIDVPSVFGLMTKQEEMKYLQQLCQYIGAAMPGDLKDFVLVFTLEEKDENGRHKAKVVSTDAATSMVASLLRAAATRVEQYKPIDLPPG
jgi:20S proteasome alpha/beta subunit